MAEMQNNNKSEIIYSLSQLWGPLSEEHQNTLLDNIQIKSFKKNQLIYKDFDGPTRMMLLYQGKVKVFKMGIGGRSQIIRAIKPMEFFGFSHCPTDERELQYQFFLPKTSLQGIRP